MRLSPAVVPVVESEEDSLSLALTSRKWYRMMRSMAHEPRKRARRKRSLSEIMVSEIVTGLVGWREVRF